VRGSRHSFARSARPPASIHGTDAPETIGHAVSSGCFRLVNVRVIDLYERVSGGTKVVGQQ
jgi:lipoprotein-anchoring transpeptidase ErfK/SrfK